jgi:cytochrome c-type biogenesis protein CcmH
MGMRSYKVVLFIAQLVVLWSMIYVGGGVVVAQTPTPEDVAAVARDLWCPLCSGVRLDVCDLKACMQMKEVIALKLQEGATPAEIKAYFVQQYGPQVMGEPPRQGFTLLAWILPFAALLIGVTWLIYMGRRWSLHRQAAQAAATSIPQTPPDSYARRLEEELKRLE